MAIHHSLQEELHQLHCNLLAMGSLVEHAVHHSVQSLTNSDGELAREVIASCQKIHRVGEDIEDHCVRLLALYHPLASDLRLVTTVMQVAPELGRVSANAKNIAKTTCRIMDQKLVKPLVDIPKMASLSVAMLHDALDALVKKNQEQAKEVWQRDDQVDQLYKDIFEELTQIMQQAKDPKRITQCAHLLFCIRFLERIADHAANIGHRVVYLVTGERA